MVDKDLKPYLLEINTNPAYFTKTDLQKEVIPTLIEDVIYVVLMYNRLLKWCLSSIVQQKKLLKWSNR